jgi:hypothetical protein
MAALWPVFGLIVLTVEWMIFRRLAPRLEGRSVGFRVLIGALAGLALSLVVAAIGLLVAVVTVALGLSEDARQVIAGAASALLVTGIVFAPIAAAFGAILLAVERYRTDEAPAPGPPTAGVGEAEQRSPTPDDRR